ncbi:MAG: hypothetical protein KDI75_05010 [Xanthomonadales bacterium]|nr:hypothetical protein [Xanthomonadales bacterium]
MTRDFAVPPTGKSALMTSLGLGMLVPLIILLALATGHTSKPPLQALFIALLMIVIVIAVFVAVFRNLRIRIDGAVLLVQGGLFCRRVDIAELDLDSARILDLNEHRERRPQWRLFGAGLPGYRVGDYYTRDKQRAFCLITDFSRVLRIERSNGHLLLVSAERPRELLKALQDYAAS